MAEKKSTGRASSSVNVSLRLDPKTKYLIDLLAREQKRTLTGVVEWALERAAEQERFDLSTGYDGPSFRDMIDVLWSTDEAVRLIALAFNKPSLMDYDEMRVWETIKSSSDLWRINTPASISKLDMTMLNVDLVQRYWETLTDHVARHRHASSIRPFNLEEHGMTRKEIDDINSGIPKDAFDEFDNEIPF